MPYVLATGFNPAEVASAFAALWPSHKFTVKTRLVDLPPTGPVIAVFPMNVRPSAGLDPAVAKPLRERGNAFFLYATRGDEAWDQPEAYAAVPHANITYAPRQSPIFDASTYNTKNAVAVVEAWFEERRLTSKVSCAFCHTAPATMTCSDCRIQSYCTDACAAAAWPQHYIQCSKSWVVTMERPN